MGEATRHDAEDAELLVIDNAHPHQLPRLDDLRTITLIAG